MRKGQTGGGGERKGGGGAAPPRGGASEREGRGVGPGGEMKRSSSHLRVAVEYMCGRSGGSISHTEASHPCSCTPYQVQA
jgi:hypothetical protein